MSHLSVGLSIEIKNIVSECINVDIRMVTIFIIIQGALLEMLKVVMILVMLPVFLMEFASKI